MRYRILGFILIVASATLVGCARDDAESIPYEPDFVELVESDKVDHIQITSEPSGLIHISGWTKPDSLPGKKFSVEALAPFNSVEALLRENQVGYSIAAAEPDQNGLSWLVTLPILISVVWVVIVIGASIIVLLLAFRFVRAIERIADNTEK